ncbi:MAG: type II toxin-antitoxin system RelE/ParE family toxin [Candidatus Peregrinibacteria bacterium]|nr:type II toxin-antitoxin system RelE/ParE family toxin [Candidatus Peregrinibacteria bacterium]
MKIVVTNRAHRQLKKLEGSIRKRLKLKLEWYLQQEDPLIFADKLTDADLGRLRYRVGDYRIIFDIDGDKLIIYQVGHRKDVYE